jgi:hypothetical protein
LAVCPWTVTVLSSGQHGSLGRHRELALEPDDHREGLARRKVGFGGGRAGEAEGLRERPPLHFHLSLSPSTWDLLQLSSRSTLVSFILEPYPSPQSWSGLFYCLDIPRIPHSLSSLTSTQHPRKFSPFACAHTSLPHYPCKVWRLFLAFPVPCLLCTRTGYQKSSVYLTCKFLQVHAEGLCLTHPQHPVQAWL